MSKLDGNERWKTKMLLTEHKEQYEQRNQDKLSGRPTTEENTLMLGFIIFPHLITMLQKSMDDMSHANVSLKEVIIRCLEYIMFSASDDFFKLKKELKTRNIRVVEEESSEDVLFFRYFCRGYDEKFGLTREVIRTELRIKLTEYTKDLGEQLKSVKIAEAEQQSYIGISFLSEDALRGYLQQRNVQLGIYDPGQY